MQECKHKRKIIATDVDCCTEGNVLSNNVNKIEPNPIPSQSPIFLLKEYELASIFHKMK